MRGFCTIAWFQAGEASKISNANKISDALSVDKVETIANTEVACEFVIVPVDETPKPLQLANYAANAFEYKAYDANGSLQTSAKVTSCDTVRAYKIMIASTLTDTQKTALAGSKVTLTVMSTTDNATITERVKVRLSNTALTSGDTWAAEPAQTLTVEPASWAKDAIVAYAAIYVNGTDSGTAETSPLQNLKFGIKFSGTAAS